MQWCSSSFLLLQSYDNSDSFPTLGDIHVQFAHSLYDHEILLSLSFISHSKHALTSYNAIVDYDLVEFNGKKDQMGTPLFMI